MKKDNLIYWGTTGIICIMMLFSGYAYFTNPDMKAAFVHLGFPDYFRMELGVAKLIGAVVLLVPQMPRLLKGLAYAGFSITFISAAIAHVVSGDTPGMIAPLVFLALLAVSYIYYQKRLQAHSL